MNINAVTLNNFSVNQQKNSQNISSFQKMRALEQDTISFSAIKVSPKTREIRRLHLKIAELLQTQTGVEVFPHQRLKTDIGLNSGKLKMLEQQINTILLRGKPSQIAISDVAPKTGDMSIRELAEKVYNHRHSWGSN